MSRSKKGKKSPGSEHWSKRPKTAANSKKATKRAERKEGKSEAKTFDGYECMVCGGITLSCSDAAGSHTCTFWS